MIGIRPNTLRHIRQKQHVIRTSPLHVSIAKMSYLKEHQSKSIEEGYHPWFKIIKPEDRRK